jgi:hypothetical protein
MHLSRPHPQSLVLASLLAAFLAAVGGCLVSSDTSQTHAGINVPESTFAQIQPGKTTVGWVQATLGEPTQKTTADGDIVWKYTYTERTDSSGALFLIFGGHSSTESTKNAFVEFKDGVVVNKWRG